MVNEIQLMLEGNVSVGEREFTRLVGGFGEDKPVISDLQVAELLGYKMGARNVRLRISENIKHFTEGIHYLDLSERVTEHNTLKETLRSLGYSKQSITQAKNIYILSRAGFLLYLKFAEGDKAVELYKDFIESYFKLEEMNKSMKKGIDEQIEALKQRKANLIGMTVMEGNETVRIQLMIEIETCGKEITELEKSKSETHVVEQLQGKLHLSNLIENAKGYYDIGVLSKVLGIKNMGRNNFMKWLREVGILQSNNTPYQQYSKHFKVILVPNNNGFVHNKSLVKPSSVSYIIKRLIKDGKVITKSPEEVLSELQGMEEK